MLCVASLCRYNARLFIETEVVMSLKIHRSALVLHSAERMFSLVNDVNLYPQFLPWCASANVLEHTDDYMVARLDVSKGAVRQSFTTRNTFEGNRAIAMELVEGPFSSLSGRWQFIHLDEGASKVELHLEFSLKKSLTKVAFGPIFNQAANNMVDAFCSRADVVFRA